MGMRCSDLSRAADEPLAATATTGDWFLLIEVPRTVGPRRVERRRSARARPAKPSTTGLRVRRGRACSSSVDRDGTSARPSCSSSERSRRRRRSAGSSSRVTRISPTRTSTPQAKTGRRARWSSSAVTGAATDAVLFVVLRCIARSPDTSRGRSLAVVAPGGPPLRGERARSAERRSAGPLWIRRTPFPSRSARLREESSSTLSGAGVLRRAGAGGRARGAAGPGARRARRSPAGRGRRARSSGFRAVTGASTRPPSRRSPAPPCRRAAAPSPSRNGSADARLMS